MKKLSALIFTLSTSFLLSAHISEIDHLMQQALVAHNVQTILEKSSKEPVEKRDPYQKVTIVEKDGIAVIRVDWDYEHARMFFQEAAHAARQNYIYPNWTETSNLTTEACEIYIKSRRDFEKEEIKKGLKVNIPLGRHTFTQCTYNQTEKAEFIRCEYALPSDFYSHVLFAAKQKTEGSK